MSPECRLHAEGSQNMMLWCRNNISASNCQCKTIMRFKKTKKTEKLLVVEVAESWPLSWYGDELETKVVSTIFIITY